MKLRRRRKVSGSPPIFANLVVEMPDRLCFHVDVESPGWLSDVVRAALRQCKRVGLAMRGDGVVRVWLAANDGSAEYLSRVLGRVAMDGSEHERVRVAGLRCNGTSAWLHRDGLVEVAPEPTWR
jgi:hypothetical protein